MDYYTNDSYSAERTIIGSVGELLSLISAFPNRITSVWLSQQLDQYSVAINFEFQNRELSSYCIFFDYYSRSNWEIGDWEWKIYFAYRCRELQQMFEWPEIDICFYRKEDIDDEGYTEPNPLLGYNEKGELVLSEWQ